MPIPVAPREMQDGVVAEIEKQFSRLDEAVAALKRIQANLKRYKASVLKAAVEGKLTEEWRKRNINVEPASELLKRILYERKKKWETEHPGKKYKEPATLDPSNLPELPTGWVWATPEMLAQHEENSICAGPFGTIFKAKDFREEGIPIIFLRQLAPGRYLTHKPGFMDKSKWKEHFQTYSVYGGDLLVTKLGEPPGICAIYPENIGPAIGCLGHPGWCCAAAQRTVRASGSERSLVFRRRRRALRPRRSRRRRPQCRSIRPRIPAH